LKKEEKGNDRSNWKRHGKYESYEFYEYMS